MMRCDGCFLFGLHLAGASLGATLHGSGSSSDLPRRFFELLGGQNVGQ